MVLAVSFGINESFVCHFVGCSCRVEEKGRASKSMFKFIENINLLTPNDDYSVRTAPLTSKCCILYIYSTNVTWSLTLREERKLRVFENRVLRRIFGPRRDEVTGEWRRLQRGAK